VTFSAGHTYCYYLGAQFKKAFLQFKVQSFVLEGQHLPFSPQVDLINILNSQFWDTTAIFHRLFNLIFLVTDADSF
jgi:hypothetical protein